MPDEKQFKNADDLSISELHVMATEHGSFAINNLDEHLAALRQLKKDNPGW